MGANYTDKFYSILRQFLRNLESSYPNLKKELGEYKKYVKTTKKGKFLKSFYNRIKPYGEDISKSNYDIFKSEEPVFIFSSRRGGWSGPRP